MVTSDPGTTSAATIKKAADAGSPGTTMVCGRSSASPRTRIWRGTGAEVPTPTSGPRACQHVSLSVVVGTLHQKPPDPTVLTPAHRTPPHTPPPTNHEQPP